MMPNSLCLLNLVRHSLIKSVTAANIGTERKEKMYSWKRFVSLYLHYYQTEIFQDEAKMGELFVLGFDFYLSRLRQFCEPAAVTPGRNR